MCSNWRPSAMIHFWSILRADSQTFLHKLGSTPENTDIVDCLRLDKLRSLVLYRVYGLFDFKLNFGKKNGAIFFKWRRTMGTNKINPYHHIRQRVRIYLCSKQRINPLDKSFCPHIPSALLFINRVRDFVGWNEVKSGLLKWTSPQRFSFWRNISKYKCIYLKIFISNIKLKMIN